MYNADTVLLLNNFFTKFNESNESDLDNKNEARKALSNNDIEGAKNAAKNVHDKAKKRQIKNEIKIKEKAIKEREKRESENQ